MPCFVDNMGVHPCHVGDLPEACASLNRPDTGKVRVTSAVTSRTYVPKPSLPHAHKPPRPTLRRVNLAAPLTSAAPKNSTTRPLPR